MEKQTLTQRFRLQQLAEGLMPVPAHRHRETFSHLIGKFRLNEALMAVYKLFWDEFSSWYLEMVKPAYQQPIDRATYDATLRFFDVLLRLLHPFTIIMIFG